MEEQKKTKEVKLNVSKKQEENAQRKYSYEELNSICAQLAKQNQELVKHIQQQELANVYTRLEFLFKVLEVSSEKTTWHFSNAFMESCVSEIEQLMTLNVEDNKDNAGK